MYTINMRTAPRYTANTLRDTFGVTSIINTKHEGETKRSTEDAASRRLDDWRPEVITKGNKPATQKPDFYHQPHSQMPTSSNGANSENGDGGNSPVKQNEKPPITLDNFASLFEPPAQLPAETIQTISNARDEIVGMLNDRLTISQRMLSNPSIAEDVRQAYADELEKARGNIEFFDSFCTRIHAENFAPGKISIEVNSDEHGGVRLRFSPVEKGKLLGRMRNIDVKYAEIVIRTGEGSDANNAYVPMQLNFRFEDIHGSEVNSWRLDMRTHQKAGSKTEIHLDANVGGSYTELKHQVIPALNASNIDPKEQFRVFQAVFFNNFMNKIGIEITSEGIALPDNLVIAESVGKGTNKHNLGAKRLAKFNAAVQNIINPPNTESIDSIQQVDSQELDETAIKKELLANLIEQHLNPKVISLLADQVRGDYQLQNPEEDITPSEADIIVAWLMQPHAKGQLDLSKKYLNGEEDALESQLTNLSAISKVSDGSHDDLLSELINMGWDESDIDNYLVVQNLRTLMGLVFAEE
jgi:hypothetical protein